MAYWLANQTPQESNNYSSKANKNLRFENEDLTDSHSNFGLDEGNKLPQKPIETNTDFCDWEGELLESTTEEEILRETLENQLQEMREMNFLDDETLNFLHFKQLLIRDQASLYYYLLQRCFDKYEEKFESLESFKPFIKVLLTALIYHSPEVLKRWIVNENSSDKDVIGPWKRKITGVTMYN